MVEFESLCVHSSLSNRQRLGHDPPGVTSHPRPRVEGWPTALWDDAFMAVDTPLRPSGSVTFLFTDVEGSTRLWEEHPTEMQVALERHDAILRTAIEGHGGYVFSTAGDAFAAAFARAGDAIEAAIDARLTRPEPWLPGTKGSRCLGRTGCRIGRASSAAMPPG